MKSKKIFIVYCIWICFIWSNSLLPATQSSSLSGSLSYQLYSLLHLPIDFELFHTFIRKCAHFSEYAVLGGLAVFSFNCWKSGIGISVLIACLDETLQLFIDGRSGQISDVLIDSAGIICGFFIIFFLVKHFLKKD